MGQSKKKSKPKPKSKKGFLRDLGTNIKILLAVLSSLVTSIGLQGAIVGLVKGLIDPNYFTNFKINIIYVIGLHSLICGLLTFIIYTWILERKRKENPFDSEIVVYKNQKEAEQDIIDDINKSSEVLIFTMRGHSFILPERAFGFLPSKRNTKVKYCVADPKTRRNPNKHIVDRAHEYEGATMESYWNDLNNDLIKVREIMKHNQTFKCKLHLHPAVFRLLIFDSHVYFSFFKPLVSGTHLSVYRANSTSDIYTGFKRFFDKMWEESTPLT